MSSDDRIDSCIETQLKKQEIPGLALAVDEIASHWIFST